MTSFADFSWRFLRRAGRLAVERQVALTTHGLDLVPLSGPVLIVANHEHHLLDGAIIMALSRRPTHIVVAADWANGPLMSRLMPRLNRAARWPMVDRRQTTAASRINRRGLEEATDLLVEGRILLVFPEGYPAIDPNGSRKAAGTVLPFGHGVEMIHNRAVRQSGQHIPVILCGLTYVEVGQDRWNVTARFAPTTINDRITANDLRSGIVDLITESAPGAAKAG